MLFLCRLFLSPLNKIFSFQKENPNNNQVVYPRAGQSTPTVLSVLVTSVSYQLSATFPTLSGQVSPFCIRFLSAMVIFLILPLLFFFISDSIIIETPSLYFLLTFHVNFLPLSASLSSFSLIRVHKLVYPIFCRFPPIYRVKMVGIANLHHVEFNVANASHAAYWFCCAMGFQRFARRETDRALSIACRNREVAIL